MSKRLNDWVKQAIEDTGSEYAIACGLDNGDVERPEWLASSPCTGIGYAIWDTDESSGQDHLYNLDTTEDGETD
jgi:hypothetical protein